MEYITLEIDGTTVKGSMDLQVGRLFVEIIAPYQGLYGGYRNSFFSRLVINEEMALSILEELYRVSRHLNEKVPFRVYQSPRTSQFEKLIDEVREKKRALKRRFKEQELSQGEYQAALEVLKKYQGRVQSILSKAEQRRINRLLVGAGDLWYTNRTSLHALVYRLASID